MSGQNQAALDEIDSKRGLLEDLAVRIWDKPETAHNETFAAEATASLLESEGFTVVRGYCGVPTAIKASWGSGRPVVGFLGEYDALPGMSQKVSTRKEPVCEGAAGEACGHNLLGVAHAGAVIGLKRLMEETGLQGTVIFYGCPAEEVATGKPLMAKAGGFIESDAAFHWHPGPRNRVTSGTMIALDSVKFHFSGVTAHAGGDPQNGRSALDAAELMNVGANFLREHVTSDVRIHYILTESGVAPNIVPDKATNYYFIRAMSRQAVEDTCARLVKVAQGAAMMTETTVRTQYMGGCYNTLQNKVLTGCVIEAMNEVGFPEYTSEEVAFAAELNAQSPSYVKLVEDRLIPDGTQIDDAVPDVVAENSFGSTDTGDVQHLVPGVMFTTATANIGAPGHSWMITSCAGHQIGLKGMINASKILACAAARILRDPSIAQKAREEFDESMKGQPYKCPIPDDFELEPA